MKNLRVCNDYHIATMFISNIVARDIIMRDAKVGIQDDVLRVRTLMKDREIKKIHVCSWIEVNKRYMIFL